MAMVLRPSFSEFLANDDAVDRIFFEEAPMQVTYNVRFTALNYVEQLMTRL